jgi:succinate dehydrogenase / fumarate reductase cytochrome b subunit
MFCSSIGRKQLIALTGLGLSGFVLMHMLGNLLILVSAQAYNQYGHALTSNPLIYLAEAGLIAMFLGHLIMAVSISLKNRAARTSRYAVVPCGDKGTSWIQKSLLLQGLLIFTFLVLHLISFKYGTHYTVDYGHGEIRDLHKLVLEIFQQPLYVAWYVVCLIVLGLHLSHGVGSSLQTFGLHHPRYQTAIRCASVGFALLVSGGFIVQPLYVFFIH